MCEQLPRPGREDRRHTEFIPQWKKAIATLQAQLSRSTNDAGLWRLKGGRGSIRVTSSGGTPPQTSPRTRFTKSDCSRWRALETQMDALLRKRAVPLDPSKTGSRNSNSICNIPTPHPRRVERRSPAQRRHHRRDWACATLLFDVVAKSACPPVPAVPASAEPMLAANYNLQRPTALPRIVPIPRRIERMTAGSACAPCCITKRVPGHLFHIALQVRTRICRALCRCARWAASRPSPRLGTLRRALGGESGWYGDDGDEGQLEPTGCRTVPGTPSGGGYRLCTPKRWTRQQAIDYSIEAERSGERYTVYPRTNMLVHDRRAEDYRVGAKAQKALGNRFALHEFYNRFCAPAASAAGSLKPRWTLTSLQKTMLQSFVL